MSTTLSSPGSYIFRGISSRGIEAVYYYYNFQTLGRTKKKKGGQGLEQNLGTAKKSLKNLPPRTRV